MCAPEDLAAGSSSRRAPLDPSTPPTGTRINRDLGSCGARRRSLGRCHGDAARLAPTAAMLSVEPKSGTRNLHAQPLTRQIIPQESLDRGNKNCDWKLFDHLRWDPGDQHSRKDEIMGSLKTPSNDASSSKTRRTLGD